jgi:membrane associated rhomboid family serine protease
MFPIRDTVPSRTTPLVVWLLVLVNGAAFAHELTLGPGATEHLVRRFGVVPALWKNVTFEVLVERPDLAWSLVSALFASMFLHGGWLHVIGNLWTLWIFGDNVEDRMGHARFLVFYLLCGVAAAATHVAFNLDSTVPTIGASGAIAGVMGAYFLLYPRARVIILIPILFYPLFAEIPAVVFLGIWFLTQLSSGSLAAAQPGDAGGIAFLAHVGGFLAGLLLHRFFLRPSR